MNILYVMMFATFILVSFFVYLFVRMALVGEFDDCDTPAIQPFYDDQLEGKGEDN